MGYKERKEFIENLGWETCGLMCNREYYYIPSGFSDTMTSFMMVEHNGSFSIANPYEGDDYFCEDPTDDEIVEYTNLVKKFTDIMCNPDKHTVLEYKNIVKDVKKFYKELKGDDEPDCCEF